MVTTNDEAVLDGRMKTSTDAQREKQAEALLKVVGDCPSVQRFLNKYGKLSIRATVLFHLERYFRWLREAKGVSMTPDELITDNLRSVYESSAVEVSKKRKHTNLLDEFVNKVMVHRGIADGSRATTASCVRQFYERSDSPLFGDSVLG